MPIAPPVSPSNKPSANSCWTKRIRCAPSAYLTEISRVRLATRTSKRPATFAHDIKVISTVMPMTINSVVTLPRTRTPLDPSSRKR